MSTNASTLRVDVWLWTTRQLRSRSLATAAARAGHVRINGLTAKASAPVRVGDEVRLRVQGFDRILVVKQLPPKRLGAPLAQECYEDLSAPRPQYQMIQGHREKGTGRPTKKERRQLEALRGEEWAKHSRR
ncbi:RNA-binding S4 domain-containing protein [Actinomycetaceae bacterium WB03_NA08]|uniref:RNA-binding S4 domain-containing protein n=1 Tax=Scrofimicrobium canadense TaxID=2652290 RepID=A0A6N7VR89_9ACTO|nr:RNA-binding S4 domain-containing protein [Scrofimicrobium canadense]MSS84267.1 RNA-binding S4 domain-containing protein [Scrofimicrobium canadense]